MCASQAMSVWRRRKCSTDHTRSVVQGSEPADVPPPPAATTPGPTTGTTPPSTPGLKAAP